MLMLTLRICNALESNALAMSFIYYIKKKSNAGVDLWLIINSKRNIGFVPTKKKEQNIYTSISLDTPKNKYEVK